jgi:hypothetical protein
MITVTEVGESGEIINFTTSSIRALHHQNAATYNNLYYTTNGAGTGATFNISKVKLINPWTVTLRDSPLG